MPEYKDIRGSSIIGIDTETKDPYLKESGPGHFLRHKTSHLVGISLADDTGWREYFPVRHAGGGNEPPDKVFDYMKEMLSGEQPKVGANIAYDIGFLAKENINVNGPWYDVASAEALIDENRRSYSLDRLANKYLGIGKTDEFLYEWLADNFGGKPTRAAQAKNIWRAPAWVVRDYAADDAFLPVEIISKQLDVLEEENLMDVFNLETDLLPVLWYMRKKGVRLNMAGAEQLKEELDARYRAVTKELDTLAGGKGRINVNAAASIAAVCDELGIRYPWTEKSAPSFRKEWLNSHTHPLMQKIAELRKIEKLSGTFVKGYIMDKSIGGRIHTMYHPLPTGHNGAVSGRLASSSPNLQNIPSRGDLAKLTRGLFIPEDGCSWVKLDYSQIEPRLSLHFSRGPVAESLRQAYQIDPTTDCYNAMMAHAPGISRPDIKTIYLGLMYGMGVNKLALQLGVPTDEAALMRDRFKRDLPHLAELSLRASRRANAVGFVRTLLGRRSRFDLWESSYGHKTPGMGLSRDKAVQLHGNAVQRAYTYKALNRIIQGGAADILKKAMVDIYKSGALDYVDMVLNVHDELDFSQPQGGNAEAAIQECKHIMENCVKLRVPLHADLERGDSWGTVK